MDEYIFNKDTDRLRYTEDLSTSEKEAVADYIHSKFFKNKLDEQEIFRDIEELNGEEIFDYIQKRLNELFTETEQKDFYNIETEIDLAEEYLKAILVRNGEELFIENEKEENEENMNNNIEPKIEYVDANAADIEYPAAQVPQAEYREVGREEEQLREEGLLAQPVETVETVAGEYVYPSEEKNNYQLNELTENAILTFLKGKSLSEPAKNKIVKSLLRSKKKKGIIKSNFLSYIETIKSTEIKKRAEKIYEEIRGSEILNYLNDMSVIRTLDEKEEGKTFLSKLKFTTPLTGDEKSYYRVARNIARELRSANQLHNMNLNNLDDRFIAEKNKLNRAAKTGNPSLILKKISDRIKKYDTFNTAEVVPIVTERLEVGAAKELAKIENSLETTGDEILNLSAATVTAYENIKKEYNAEYGGTSDAEVSTFREETGF